LDFDACTLSRTNGRGIKLKGLRERLAGVIRASGGKPPVSKRFRQPFHVYTMKMFCAFPDLPQPQPLDFYPCVCPDGITRRHRSQWARVPEPHTGQISRPLRQAIVRVQDTLKSTSLSF
jgi:hypothetical protein